MNRSGASGGRRVARLELADRKAYLVVDEQEWFFGNRFTRRSKRLYEVKHRWRVVMPASGDYDEGLFSDGDLEELEHGQFTYRGDHFQLEWLDGDEAEAVNDAYFSGWA